MAGRIRTIKPELLEDAKTAGLSDTAFRVFIALILLSDDYGNGRGEPRFLEGQVYWSASPEKLMRDACKELESLVTFYVVRGQVYAHINGWEKHQRVQHPGSPRVPRIEERDAGDSPETLINSRETLAPDLRSPISDHDPDHDRQPSPTDPRPSSETREQEDRVFVHWADRLYPGSKVKFDDKRRKRIRARLSDGFTADDLQLAVDGATKDDWIMGRDAKARKGGYRDIETVFRDVAQVERLMGLTTEGQRRLSSGPQKRRDGSVDGVPAKTVKDAPQAILVPIGPRQEFRGAKTPAELALMDNLMSKIGAGPPKSNGHTKSAIDGETLEDRALASRAALARMGETK